MTPKTYTIPGPFPKSRIGKITVLIDQDGDMKLTDRNGDNVYIFRRGLRRLASILSRVSGKRARKANAGKGRRG